MYLVTFVRKDAKRDEGAVGNTSYDITEEEKINLIQQMSESHAFDWIIFLDKKFHTHIYDMREIRCVHIKPVI